MPLTKYKLGDLIQESFRKNTDLQFDISYVRGISNNKQITNTKADVDSGVIHKFYIVNPGEFVYNPRTTRMGNKLGLGYNNTNTPLLFSFNNVAFYIKEQAKKTILPEYLFMFFNRSEFDRYAMINGWGSATELFGIEEMYDVDIELPPVSVQQKYVNLYLSILENQLNYERGLNDLKLTCDAYIENLRRNTKTEKIGKYLIESDKRNELNLDIDAVRGLATSKEMIPTKADMEGVSLSNYKTVLPRQIAYVPDTSRRGDKVSMGINGTTAPVLVSSISIVFGTKKSLIPEYLMLFLTRAEFDRYARFHSWGSVREIFSFEDMCEVEIPIPDTRIQQTIANLYEVYVKRKNINEQLKSQIKDLCPILIKGSLVEAS